MAFLDINFDQGVIYERLYEKDGSRPDRFRLIHINEVAAFESKIKEMEPEPDYEMSYELIFHLKSGHTITFDVRGAVKNYEDFCTQIQRAVFGLGAESKPNLRPVK
jgi:hypothetical protein